MPKKAGRSSPHSASTASIASFSVGPECSRWLLSSVNEIDAGNPTRAAARATPTASGTLLKVMASTRSTSALARVAIWVEW